jgi:hypothetical protein
MQFGGSYFYGCLSRPLSEYVVMATGCLKLRPVIAAQLRRLQHYNKAVYDEIQDGTGDRGPWWCSRAGEREAAMREVTESRWSTCQETQLDSS